MRRICGLVMLFLDLDAAYGQLHNFKNYSMSFTGSSAQATPD